MRISSVEAAGAGGRANSPGAERGGGGQGFQCSENYGTQELACHVCRSWRGRVKPAREASGAIGYSRLRLPALGVLRLVTSPEGQGQGRSQSL